MNLQPLSMFLLFMPFVLVYSRPTDDPIAKRSSPPRETKSSDSTYVTSSILDRPMKVLRTYTEY